MLMIDPLIICNRIRNHEHSGDRIVKIFSNSGKTIEQKSNTSFTILA
ncbi:hypothetical protein CLV53_10131 [Sediminibacterium magnilacihabitans]|nr:hypothetical protein CLV53_10131 [Sediminibacterium magnilacihabitans]